MCTLSEGIKKNPVEAAEVEGERDLLLVKSAALNRAKCGRGPSSNPTRLQQALINSKTLNAPSVPTAGRTRRNFRRAKAPNTATKAANDETSKYPEEYHIGPDRCRLDPTNFRWPESTKQQRSATPAAQHGWTQPQHG